MKQLPSGTMSSNPLSSSGESRANLDQGAKNFPSATAGHFRGGPGSRTPPVQVLANTAPAAGWRPTIDNLPPRTHLLTARLRRVRRSFPRG